MSAFTDHEKQLAHAKHYSKYAHEYDAVFAYNKEAPKFDESAEPSSKQWARLETRRGNDRSAYHEWKEQQGNTSLKPEPREQRLWEANATNSWNSLTNAPNTAIESDLTNSPWLDLTPADRRSASTQKWFQQVEAKYQPQYQQLTAPEIDEKSFMQGCAVLVQEHQQARRQAQSQQVSQPQEQAASVSPNAQATPQPIKSSRLSTASFSGQTPDATAIAPANRSRLSMENFTSGQAVSAQLKSELQAMTPSQRQEEVKRLAADYQDAKGHTIEQGVAHTESMYKLRVATEKHQDVRNGERAQAQVRERDRGLSQ